MSADNVTPIRGGEEPPAGDELEASTLGFSEGDEGQPGTFQVFQGLKGVCRAMNALDAIEDNLNQLCLLSEAAAVLVDILDDRQTSS